jgi:mono/diheme cytochrome c family protein
MSSSRILAGAALVAFASCGMHAAYAQAAKAAGKNTQSQLIERGRYLVKIGGCNDCHTPGYPESGGKVPEKQWLVGHQVGWQGPWGTTYPSNLRLSMQSRTEDEWVKMAHGFETRPPMPWFAVRDMTTQDLRALYRFVRYLGPAGEPAPAYVPPGQEAKGPVIRFPAPPK